MSRKQSVRPRAGKKADVERKRDERAARRALAKERRNRSGEEVDNEEFLSFGKQLQALGLRMREVPGDGNCLFRALGDQLEGHSRNHLKHRQDTVDYMIKHRCDFEPFVEDDVPFDKHVGNLSQAGTFAGNDAIVAFARNNQVNIVIHQLNNPLWHIRGSDKANVRELHIAYRYGEHYDSVRHTNDNAETPANLQTEMHSKDESNWKVKKSNLTEDRQGDAVQKVRNATGCADAKLIVQSLEAESYNIESAIHVILQIEELKQIGGGADCTPEDQDLSSSARDCDRPERRSEEKPAKPVEDASEQRRVQEEKKDSHSHKVSNKQRKEQQRQQKKKRQEERHKQRVQEQRGNNTDNNQQPEGGDAGASVTVVKAVAALNI
ncbi:OTU domain-containing protein 3 [Hyperolius riggenbachi]|uniref:OTU domain-containing protein 3 n=1 Tax=Hyperolius riggenbachi TaxID=752182 RepID=UPI0035A2706B